MQRNRSLAAAGKPWAAAMTAVIALLACGNDDESSRCLSIGRYQAGKGAEGTTYVPCCAGLTEIGAMYAAKDAAGADICTYSLAREYACIAGTCGDGVCEEPENSCGCPNDCGGPPFPPPLDESE